MKTHSLSELDAFARILRSRVWMTGFAMAWGMAVLLFARDRLALEENTPIVDCIVSMIFAVGHLIVGVGIPCSKKLQRLMLVENSCGAKGGTVLSQQQE